MPCHNSTNGLPLFSLFPCRCEPTLFTFNTDVMSELNEKGIPLFEKDFVVERITSGMCLCRKVGVCVGMGLCSEVFVLSSSTT